MLIIAAILVYIAIFLFVVQDFTNALGLPGFVVDHFAHVFKVIKPAARFVQDNVYDSRDFNVEQL